MPKLTRYFIKTALIYFVAALLMGTVLMAQSALRLPAWVNALYPVYLHWLILGWITQLIFGVVYWMFPKRSKDQPRGSERLGWAVYILLNIGLILRALGEPLLTTTPEIRWLLPLSALLQLLAGYGFIANTWTRVRER